MLLDKKSLDMILFGKIVLKHPKRPKMSKRKRRGEQFGVLAFVVKICPACFCVRAVWGTGFLDTSSLLLEKIKELEGRKFEAFFLKLLWHRSSHFCSLATGTG